MDKEHTCCVTGHRTIPFEKVSLIQRQLKDAVLEAVSQGYAHFISGFASGADLMFAEIVVDLKDIVRADRVQLFVSLANVSGRGGKL